VTPVARDMLARRIVGFGAAITVLTVACSAGTAPQRTASPKPVVFARGGTLHVVLANGLLGDLDPQDDYFANDWEIFRCCLLRTLLSYSGRPTGQGGAQLQPDLAAQMPEVSSDGLTWTFRLKRNIHYAPPFQAEEVVAQDFIRAMRRELDPTGDFPYAGYYDVIQGASEYSGGKSVDIAGMEALDPHTLVVHLTEPTGDLGYRFSLPATAPIPPNPLRPKDPYGAAWDLVPCPGCAVTYGDFLVSTGPYMYEGAADVDYSKPFFKGSPDHLLRQDPPGFAPGKSLTLVRNPSWNGATDRLRPAYPDRMEFTLGYPLAKVGPAVEAGRFDVSLDINAAPSELSRYRSDPAFKGRLFVNSGDALVYMAMNLATRPFDDLHVRKAVTWAIDKAALLRAYESGGGLATLTGHAIDNSSESNLLLQYDPFATPGGKGDTTKARAEMARSPYDHDRDGVCDDPACSKVLAFARSDPPLQPVAPEIQAALGKIGITLRILPKDANDYGGSTAVHADRVALALTSRWLRDYPDAGGEVTQQLLGRGVESGGFTSNFSLLGVSPNVLEKEGYPVTSVPSVDDRIQSCLTLIGTSRVQCWAALDQFVMENVVPWVPYFIVLEARLVSARVVHYSFDQFAARPALDQIALKPGG
jgi:peptide/nickel transport system substrate-binding protein